uniref:Uncharacterized protein n=1 Tax=Acrobeloides nanus TaxID=290746 RepID=A0A914C885_9BILA
MYRSNSSIAFHSAALAASPTMRKVSDDKLLSQKHECDQQFSGLKRSPTWNCEVPRGCLKDRNDLITIQSDNSTLLTKGWNNFTSNLPSSDQALVQQYTNNILNIIYGPVPSGGPDQQISQVVTQIQNCKAAVPGRASDVDKVLFGNWGHSKKFQDCQSSATTKQYPSK